MSPRAACAAPGARSWVGWVRVAGAAGVIDALVAWQEPSDLGYWIGYRITKAYYRNATDKRQALRDIIELRDPKAILAKSGWHPGMTFD